MSQNTQPLQKPSPRSRIGAFINGPAYPMEPNPYSEPKEGSRLRQSYGWGPLPQTSPSPVLNHYSQVKQRVPDSSFVEAGWPPYDHPSAALRAVPPGTVTQQWNNHTRGVSATVSVSGSSRSHITAMSIDEGSADSRLYRKPSSKMSVDYPPMTGTRRKTSSRMSVDPSSPNVHHSTQRRTSSRMSVDVSSASRTRMSSDRMLFDEVPYDCITQNYQKLPSAPSATFTTGTHLTAPPTVYTSIYSVPTNAPQEYTFTSCAAPHASSPMTISRERLPSHDRRFPRGDVKLMPLPPPPPPSSFMQHIQGKDKFSNVSPATSALPLTYTSRLPVRTSVPPLHQVVSATPSKKISNKQESPTSSRSPSTRQETAVHSPITAGRIRLRGSSSGDEPEVSRKRVRQHSPPTALLASEPRPACNPTPQQTHSLSPIDEIQWLPPMEQQLKSARQSQLKAEFRKFKAIIGGAVGDIKQVIVPYNKDHRKHKIVRTRSGCSKPFTGVPDYLRSSKPICTPRSHSPAPSDVKEMDAITDAWTKVVLCDSPTSLYGDDGAAHGEVPQLSLSPPRINEPPRSSCSSRLSRETAGDGSVAKVQLGNDCVGAAANLGAPTFSRRRTSDAVQVRGVPRSPY